jgi:hypothetical protein
MRTLLVLLLVFLTGCLTRPIGDLVEAHYEPEIKQKNEVIIKRIEEEINNLADAQYKLNVIMEFIKSKSNDNNEWIRASSEVDPREIYKL